MSEKLQEKIDEVIRNRERYLTKIKWFDLENKKFLITGNNLYYEIKEHIGKRKASKLMKWRRHSDASYFLSYSQLILAQKEVNLSLEEILDFSHYNDRYDKGFKYHFNDAIKLNYESWQKFKKIGDFLIKHQDKLIEEIEIENKKKELYRLTRCERIYNHLSDCDTVCELCGNVIKIGEKCSCIEKSEWLT